jgi:GBP family porin
VRRHHRGDPPLDAEGNNIKETMMFKKGTVLGLALGCMIGSPLTAHSQGKSQSNVTVYGKVDLGLRYINNSDSSNRSLFDQKSSTNRIGFRGRESIGEGLAAILTLENGFNGDTGGTAQGGRLFGRQAFVGIESKSSGTVTLGRQYDFVTVYVGSRAAGVQAWGGSPAAHFGDIDNANSYFRIENSMKYASPVRNGISFGALYGIGEASGKAGKNRTYSLGASYQSGPFYLGAGTIDVNNPIVAVYDGNLTTNTKGTFGSSPYAGLQAADRLQVAALAAAYQFGKAGTVGVLVTDTRFTNSLLAKGDADYQVYEVNGTYNVTPTVLVGASYHFTEGHWDSNNSKPRFHQVNFGGAYLFSKRTSIYWRNAYQKAAGDAKFAQINLLPASGCDSQFMVNLGLKHNF